MDRRVDTFLKRNFEATSLAFRPIATNSIMAGAAFVWADKMSSEPKLSKKAKSCLKKISLAMAFAADFSYDALVLSAWALVANTVMRRNLWLRHWGGEETLLLQPRWLGYTSREGNASVKPQSPFSLKVRIKESLPFCQKVGPQTQDSVLSFSRVLQT